MASFNQQLVPLKAEANYFIGQRLAVERGGRLPPHQLLDKLLLEPDNWNKFGIRGTLSGDLLVSPNPGEKFTIKGDLVDERTRIIIPERYLVLFNKNRGEIIGKENIGVIIPINPALSELREVPSKGNFLVVEPITSKMTVVYNMAGDGQLGRVNEETRLPVQSSKDELRQLTPPKGASEEDVRNLREQKRLLSGGVGGIRFLVEGVVDLQGAYGKENPIIIFTGAGYNDKFYISMVTDYGSP
jgi:hypothetical protein